MVITNKKIFYLLSLVCSIVFGLLQAIVIKEGYHTSISFLTFIVATISFMILLVGFGIILSYLRKSSFNWGKIDKIFFRQRNIFLLFLIIWGIILIPIFPGTFSGDFNNMIIEFFSNVKNVKILGLRPVYDYYVTGHYLLPNSTTFLTNQHNIFSVLVYGFLSKMSVQLTGNLFLGYFIIGISQFLLSLYCISRVLFQISRKLRSSLIKITVLFLFLLNPILIYSSVFITKNPLFSVSSLLFISLIIEFINNNHEVTKKWHVLLILSMILQLISVKWSLYALFITLIVLIIIYRKYWRYFVFNMLMPIVFFKIALILTISFGGVIPDDPIEGKTVQLAQIALYLERYPNDLTKKQYTELDKIIKVDTFPKLLSYTGNLTNLDPLKSTGDLKWQNADNLGYRYETVTKADMKHFNSLWISMMAKHPDTFIDIVFAKNTNYFKLGQVGGNNFSVSYTDSPKNLFPYKEKGVATPGFSTPFPSLLKFTQSCVNQIATNSWTSKILAVSTLISTLLFLLPYLVERNIKFIWLYLFLMMQIGVCLASPLDGSARYALGLYYVFPVLIGLLFWDKKLNETHK
jgi:hypothetical protein